MQDRKFNSITKAIETYKDSDSESLMPGQTKNFFEDVLLANVKFGDRGAIYLGGLPNYSYYKAEFKKKNPKATEQEATFGLSVAFVAVCCCFCVALFM